MPPPQRDLPIQSKRRPPVALGDDCERHPASVAKVHVLLDLRPVSVVR